jgi:hypothetical protein
MKTRNRFVAPLAFIIWAAALIPAGCSWIGIGVHTSTGTGTSATLQGVTDDYQQAQTQTAATVEALEGLSIADLPDLKQAYGYFSANQHMMEQIGERLIRHADGMFFRGSYYFVESGRSLEACAFPRTGKTDDLRSVDLGEDFDALSGAGGEIKRAFRAFQFDIRQIREVLVNHLNLSTIDTIGFLTQKARVDSESLQNALRHALTTLEHAKTTLPQRAPRKG